MFDVDVIMSLRTYDDMIQRSQCDKMRRDGNDRQNTTAYINLNTAIIMFMTRAIPISEFVWCHHYEVPMIKPDRVGSYP